MSDADVVSLHAWRSASGAAKDAEPASSDVKKSDVERANDLAATVISLSSRVEPLSTSTHSGQPADSSAGAGEAAAALGDLLGENSAVLQARSELDRLLTRRDRSESELRGALQGRELSSAAIEQVLADARQNGDIDDWRIADDVARQTLRRRGQGSVIIRRTLEERGFSREVIDDTLSALDADQQIEQAELLARKRLRAVGGQPPAVQRQRISATLQRKGFDSETIHLALARVLS